MVSRDRLRLFGVGVLGLYLGACFPPEEVDLPPLVAKITNGADLDPSATPIQVVFGNCKENRGILAYPLERYARLCAACEVELRTGQDPILTYKTQKVLCQTYGMYHQGRAFERKQQTMGKDDQGNYCADVTGDDRYQVVPTCDSEGTCYCQRFKQTKPYISFRASQYLNEAMDTKLADTYGQILAPKTSKGCEPTIEIQYRGKGVAPKGWSQGDTFGETTWQGVVAKIKDSAYQQLAPCTLPYAQGGRAMLASDSPANRTPPSSAQTGSSPATSTPQSPGAAGGTNKGSNGTRPFQAVGSLYSSDGRAISALDHSNCTVCQTDAGCGCWDTRLEGDTIAGYCKVHGPCEEQLGPYYGYFFGGTAPTPTSGTRTSTQRPTSRDTPERNFNGNNNNSNRRSSSRGNTGDDVAAADGCSDDDLCNGTDDDCDLSTIDGSADPRLYEACDLPKAAEEALPESMRLVAAPDSTQGALICRDGVLTCVDTVGRSQFEQSVEAAQQANQDRSQDSGCPAVSTISQAPARRGVAGWLVVALLIALRSWRRGVTSRAGRRPRRS